MLTCLRGSSDWLQSTACWPNKWFSSLHCCLQPCWWYSDDQIKLELVVQQVNKYYIYKFNTWCYSVCFSFVLSATTPSPYVCVYWMIKSVAYMLEDIYNNYVMCVSGGMWVNHDASLVSTVTWVYFIPWSNFCKQTAMKHVLLVCKFS